MIHVISILLTALWPHFYDLVTILHHWTVCMEDGGLSLLRFHSQITQDCARNMVNPAQDAIADNSVFNCSNEATLAYTVGSWLLVLVILLHGYGVVTGKVVGWNVGTS